jgi:energy-coupling factor transporter transmembrane protein EcfT
MSNPTPTPAGWYDDGTGTNTQRYWDGSQWTQQTQPAPGATTLTAPVGAAPLPPATGIAPTKERNVLGIVALVVAVVGFIFACVPGALIIGWVLLPIAFILAIVAVFLKGKGKALALTALIVSVVGTVVGFVVFFAVVANSFSVGVGNTSTQITPPAAAESSDAPKPGAAKAGTRTNPAALGSEIVGHNFTVTINSVNVNGTDAVLAANQFNKAPADGNVYALVNATITYTGADSGYASEAQVSYVSAEGKVYNSWDSLQIAPDPAFGLDELYTGAAATGNLVIEIPAAGDGLIRVTPGILADDVFVSTK